jgi:SRSO17 transposase
VTWRQGTRATQGHPDAAMTSHFLAIRVRPANRGIPRADDGSLPECWLRAEWPPHAGEPADYGLADLPADTPIAELVRLAKIRWRIEHDYRDLKTGLGPVSASRAARSPAGTATSPWPPLPRHSCTMIRLDPEVPAPG